jgi:putative FmdB family regulatory protein
MPIYEYRCEKCGTEFEKLVRRSADSNGVTCPSCGHSRLTLRLSVFAAPQSARRSAQAPSCPSGMCPTPDLCGRN